MVRLRAMEPEDLDFLYYMENDSTSWDVGATTMPYSHDILRQYILSTTGDIYTDKQVRLIIETSDGITIGIADLANFDPKNMKAEVGIMILQEYRNHGFATEALSLLEQYSHKTIHLHQLYVVVPCSNSSSIKLFENRQFICTSELKDWLFDGENYQNALLLQKIL